MSTIRIPILTCFLLTLVLSSEAQTTPKDILEWHVDFEKAKVKAETDNKFILLYFSGTGWCQSCIQLDKNILDTDVFSLFASEEFVPVKLDFPKLKKKKYPKKNPFSSRRTCRTV